MDLDAVGAEILRCTGAFLRGQESFSPSDVAIQSAWVSTPSSTWRRCDFRRGHRLSPQPLDPWVPPITGRGTFRGRLFFDSIERILYSARGSRLLLLDDSVEGFDLSLAVIPVCSGSPVGGGIPPGGYPSAFATALASFHSGQMSVFLVYEVDLIAPRGTSTKFVGPVLRIFPFQGFPPPPFSLVYEPPGFCFGGGFPRPRRGALRDRFLPKAFQPRVCSTGPPFSGLPDGGDFLGDQDSRSWSLLSLSRQQTFRDPREVP